VSGMEPPVGPPRDHAAESLQLPFALEPPDVFLADRLLIQDCHRAPDLDRQSSASSSAAAMADSNLNSVIPSVITSPLRKKRRGVRLPFTSTPFLDPRSTISNLFPSMATPACLPETAPSRMRMLFSGPLPRETIFPTNGQVLPFGPA